MKRWKCLIFEEEKWKVRWDCASGCTENFTGWETELTQSRDLTDVPWTQLFHLQPLKMTCINICAINPTLKPFRTFHLHSPVNISSVKEGLHHQTSGTFTSTIWTQISHWISFNLHFFPITSTSKQPVLLICLLIFFLYLSLWSALTEQLQLSFFICFFLLLARKSKSSRTHVFKVYISMPIKVWFAHLSFIQKVTLKKQILIF